MVKSVQSVAGVFDGGGSDTRVACTLSLIQGETLKVEGQGLVLLLPLSGLKLSLGGAGDRLIFISHSTVSHKGSREWTLFTSDMTLTSLLLRSSNLPIRDEVRKISRARHRVRVSMSSWALGLIGVVVLLYTLQDSIATRVVRFIPIPWEERFGDTVYPLVTASQEQIEDEKITELFSEIVSPLVPTLKESGFSPKISIFRSSDYNAFAVAGGYVVVLSPVIAGADTVEEVLGVVAHEFAHVSERHVMRGIVSSAALYGLFDLAFGGGVGAAATLADLAPYLMSQSYSRTLESDADRVGVQSLMKSSINPRGLPEFLRRVHEKYESGVPAAISQAASFLATHPETRSRIADIEAYIAAEEGKRSEPIVYRSDLSKKFLRLKKLLAEKDKAENIVSNLR